MSKKSRFRGCSNKEYGNHAQVLMKSTSRHLYNINWSLEWKLSSKESLLLTCKILGLLVNTLGTNEKYPVFNRENLTIQIEMQLSQKQKTFPEFLPAFLKTRLNFEYFEKKDHPRSFCIFEITGSENVVR